MIKVKVLGGIESLLDDRERTDMKLLGKCGITSVQIREDKES